MSDAVVIENVEKRFGEIVAVRDFSLRVPKGCVYGFIGPNGAGKTTIMRMIVSIFHPDRGRISVLGSPSAARVKSRLGYLPEEKGLYRKMRVGELVAYFAQLKGMEAGRARQRAEELLSSFGLGDWTGKRCETLSKGMAQKVQIICTVIHDPDLVILDEPFSGLDPVNTDLMRDLVLEMKREGRSVIFSTHVMEQAEQICDYVVLVDRGQKVLDGSLSDVRAGNGRAIVLDYDGDGAALGHLPGVVRVNDAGKQAELFLETDADPQQVLAALVGRVRVQRFDLRAPSLHEVFLRAVGRSDDV